MKVKLSKSMILAIQAGLDELENSGMWCEDLSKKEVKKIEKGIEELEKMLNAPEDVQSLTLKERISIMYYL